MMLKKWLSVCYAAMMFMEKKRSPKDWKDKIVYILNYYVFFILASFLSNFMIHYDLIPKQKIYVYVILGVLSVFVFNSNKKRICSFLLSNNFAKNYKRNSYKEFFSLTLVIISFFLVVGLFIFSHKIQNYI